MYCLSNKVYFILFTGYFTRAYSGVMFVTLVTLGVMFVTLVTLGVT